MLSRRLWRQRTANDTCVTLEQQVTWPGAPFGRSCCTASAASPDRQTVSRGKPNSLSRLCNELTTNRERALFIDFSTESLNTLLNEHRSVEQTKIQTQNAIWASKCDNCHRRRLSRGDFGALTHVVSVYSVSVCSFHASCAFRLIACSICRAVLLLDWVRDARFASLSKSLLKLWWC